MNTHPQDNSTLAGRCLGNLYSIPHQSYVENCSGDIQFPGSPDLPHKQAERDTVTGTRPLIKRTLRVAAQGFSVRPRQEPPSEMAKEKKELGAPILTSSSVYPEIRRESYETKPLGLF